MESKTCIKRAGNSAGFTLVELTAAMGLFLLVLGFTAQSLVGYYVSMDLTEQRAEAVQNATSILNAMRAARNASPNNFPGALVTTWPQGTVLQDSDSTPPADRVTSLPAETLTITYLDAAGQLIGGNPTAAHNPLQVMITSQWTTLKKGVQGTASISTMLTNE